MMTYGPKADLIAHTMRDFIAHGRKESAKWWGGVWGVSPSYIHTVARRSGCKAAIDMVSRGGYAPIAGTIPTHIVKNAKNTRIIRVGGLLLRRAGLHHCERVKYRVRDGEIVLSGV